MVIFLGYVSKTISISLPTSGCGVRLTSSVDENGQAKMYYTVAVVVQHDRYLRQISDQEKLVRCMVEDDAFLVKSQSLFNALKTEIKDKNVNHR